MRFIDLLNIHAIQHFKHSDATKVHNGIIFDFCTGPSQAAHLNQIYCIRTTEPLSRVGQIHACSVYVDALITNTSTQWARSRSG